MSLSDTRQLVEAERAHEGDEHAAAADDHVGPRLLQPGVVDPVGQRLGGERAEHVLGGRPGQCEVVDPVAVVLGQPELDRGDGGDGAGQADDRRAPPASTAGTRGQVLELGGRPAMEAVSSSGAGGSLREVLLGEAHAADVDRRDAFGLGRADHALRRPAADVDDEERTRRRVELAMSHRGSEAALVLALEQLGTRRRSPLGGVEEVVTVAGVPGGGGGGDPHRDRRRARPGRAVLAQHVERALDGLRREPPVASTPCPSRVIRISRSSVVKPAPSSAARRPAAGPSWCRSRWRRRPSSSARALVAELFGRPSGPRGRRRRRGTRRSGRGGT